MYEMLVGYPPFYSDEPMTTCRKVCNCSHYFAYIICIYLSHNRGGSFFVCQTKPLSIARS